MERFFILDKFNTWYDWRAILTGKSIPDPEPKTNYVEIDGMDGSLDLSEALTGEVVYNDRTLEASFLIDSGTVKDRATLLRQITTALHGKKVQIIEPDDLDHYFTGRVKIKTYSNTLPYLEFTLEATCDPWRYALEETVRSIDVTGDPMDIVIRNSGVKSVCPTIAVTGAVTLAFNGSKIELTEGVYKVPSLKFKQGFSVVNVSGEGSVTFTYREATL